MLLRPALSFQSATAAPSGRFFAVKVHAAFRLWPILTRGTTGRLCPVEQHQPLDGFLERGGRERVSRSVTEQRHGVETCHQLHVESKRRLDGSLFLLRHGFAPLLHYGT